MNIRVCDKHGKCDLESTRIGNTEMLFGHVSKGTEYHIELDYQNSIIVLSSFFDCPNAHLEISMVKVQEAHKIYESHSAKSEAWIAKETAATNAKIGEIADVFSRSSGREIIKYERPETVLVYKLEKSI